jgi:hypothetical protein
MALRTASPSWLSLVYVGGLFLLFLGQRAFHAESLAPIITAVGALAIVGVTGFRAYAMLQSRGARRRIERSILWCYLGCGLALLIYALTTTFGMKLLGLDDLSAAGAARYKTAMLVGWALVMFVSLVPLAMIEFTMLDYAARVASRSTLAGTMSAEDREKFSAHEEDLEHVRVSHAGWSGLSIALLAGLLLVTCQVANEKNVRRDVSYFKTSAPGGSTVKIAKASKESFRVLLFFPEVNAVKDEVKGYFDSLAAETGKATCSSTTRTRRRRRPTSASTSSRPTSRRSAAASRTSCATSTATSTPPCSSSRARSARRT